MLPLQALIRNRTTVLLLAVIVMLLYCFTALNIRDLSNLGVVGLHEGCEASQKQPEHPYPMAPQIRRYCCHRIGQFLKLVTCNYLTVTAQINKTCLQIIAIDLVLDQAILRERLLEPNCIWTALFLQ